MIGDSSSSNNLSCNANSPGGFGATSTVDQALVVLEGSLASESLSDSQEGSPLVVMVPLTFTTSPIPG